MKHVIYSLLTLLLISSCVVSKKKYDDMLMRKSQLEYEKDECNKSLAAQVAKSDSLQRVIDSLRQDVADMRQDSVEMAIEYQRILANYKNLSKTYDALQKNHDYLKNANTAEIERYSKTLAQKEKEVNELQTSLQAREKRVKELENIISEKEKASQALKDKISAVLNVNTKDLTIYVKDGKVYVSVSDRLLFKSGSIEVDPKGQEALHTLSGVLKDNKDFTIMVEGHTDDVPISKGTAGMKDNWDLSVLRATSITRILIAGGVDPKNIVPSGRGEYMPLDVTKTAEGRSKNRRTEIILTPKLDELYQILK
jgi:chemotaxis protein MotB